MKTSLSALIAALAVPVLLSTTALAQPEMFQDSGISVSAPVFEGTEKPAATPKIPPPAELQKKADAGDAGAMRDIGLFYRNSRDNDWVVAHQWFVKAAEKGDTAAQYYAGRDFWWSHGVPHDAKAAQAWLEKAAAADNTQAQALLGQILKDGEKDTPAVTIIAPDPARARTLLKQAAEKGNMDAEYSLAVSYMSEPAEESQKAGFALLEKAAAHGDVLAQRKLGQLYYSGETGGGVDLVKSREYFEKAAVRGDIIAQYFLGRYYELGKGVDMNGAKAAEWFRKVDLQEDPVDENEETQVNLLMGAQLRLGVLYRDGTGVKKDLAEAARWFARAARTGSPAAQVHLAEAYENGAGVPQDKIKAYLWYGLGAGENGSPFPPDNSEKTGVAEAKAGIARIEKTMKPEEIAAAKQTLVDEERALQQIYNAHYRMATATGGNWMIYPP